MEQHEGIKDTLKNLGKLFQRKPLEYIYQASGCVTMEPVEPTLDTDAVTGEYVTVDLYDGYYDSHGNTPGDMEQIQPEVQEDLAIEDLAKYCDLKYVKSIKFLKLSDVWGDKFTHEWLIQTSKKLNAQEEEALKDYLVGQFADGFGEGFEQKEFEGTDWVENTFLVPNDEYDEEDEDSEEYLEVRVSEDIDVNMFVHLWQPKNYKQELKRKNEMKENLSIKQINEKLQQFLELSPETKQNIVNKRRQNALDAMDKYAKSKALAGRKGVQPMEADAAKGSILNITDEIPAEMDLDLAILTALKNCNFDDEDVQEELQGGSCLADLVAPNLKELSVEEVKTIMEHKRDFLNNDNSLYPSGWPADKFGPYPEKLAQALVLTEDSESLTDVFNIFYANRQISEKAAHVFMKDALEDPMGITKDMVSNAKDYDIEYIPDMLKDIAEKYPQFVEDFKKKYHV